MNEKLKKAFDQITAEEELKSTTKEFIFQKTKGYTTKKTANYRHLISAFACFVFFLLGGHWLYFSPTVEISIDINPSVELGVNRFNRVISFESYNDDGKELINSLDIKYMNYSDAVNRIMESEEIVSLLSNDEILTIAVIGTGSTQSEEVFSNIQSCTAGNTNTYCYYAHSEEVEKAHDAGLSYGKYKAFLEVQALDPTITADEVQNMTMREIRDLISSLSGDQESGTESSGNGNSNGGSGNGNGNSNGGSGNSNGNSSSGNGNSNGNSGSGNGNSNSNGGNSNTNGQSKKNAWGKSDNE